MAKIIPFNEECEVPTQNESNQFPIVSFGKLLDQTEKLDHFDDYKLVLRLPNGAIAPIVNSTVYKAEGLIVLELGISPAPN